MVSVFLSPGDIPKEKVSMFPSPHTQVKVHAAGPPPAALTFQCYSWVLCDDL